MDAQRSEALTRVRTIVIALALVNGACHAQESGSDAFPGMRLLAPLESHLERERANLRAAPGHAGLVFELEREELLGFMEQIRIHRDGADFVLGTEDVAEAHPGGVLALLLDHWRPDGRTARLGDAFWFVGNRASLELAKIYEGYRRQILLPVPGRQAGEIDGRLPTSPQLARMRFHFGSRAQPLEGDAYKTLGLLVAHEADTAATWTNHRGQTLSVDRLLRAAFEYYLAERGAELEIRDHSNLHLVELLLAYDRRTEGARGADAIKRRFLETELARREFGEERSEIIGHYAESLGRLLADPRVSWQAHEKQQVRQWLTWLDEAGLQNLAGVDNGHLCHLLLGLRLIEDHRSKLES